MSTLGSLRSKLVRLLRCSLAIPGLTLALVVAGCANVPQEVVDLSNVMGEDMAVVHESHRTLIKQHYENIRRQRLDFLESRWTPHFVEKMIAKGRLVDIAQGNIVWNVDKKTFTPPTPGQAQKQLVYSVAAWAEEAIYQIEKKRKAILAPIDKDEKELLAAVDDAFARLFRGNAAITAHLNSLSKVQGAQDDVLKALNLKDLRISINERLAKASDKAALSTSELEELEKDLERLR